MGCAQSKLLSRTSHPDDWWLGLALPQSVRSEGNGGEFRQQPWGPRMLLFVFWPPLWLWRGSLWIQPCFNFETPAEYILSLISMPVAVMSACICVLDFIFSFSSLWPCRKHFKIYLNSYLLVSPTSYLEFTIPAGILTPAVVISPNRKLIFSHICLVVFTRLYWFKCLGSCLPDILCVHV